MREEAARYGETLKSTIQGKLDDPQYRKHYLVYKIRSELAYQIKSLREAEKLTQKQLADKVGVPQSVIARAESLEDERVPSLDFLVRVFYALKTRAFLEIIPPPQTQEQKREVVLV
ncbi:MAG: helix-turn-helix transcriptional regulator [Elusimicrobia bacterium]|nr:helix-turn-helix transcriptional regulator [Elusimicrobiota bacterium]